MYQIDPSKPYAKYVNDRIAEMQSLSFDAVYTEQLKAYGGGAAETVPFVLGDPLSGTMIPGTRIPWDQSTEIQGYIYEFFREGGQAPPADFEAELTVNAGPDEYWNWAYSQWGLIPGVPASSKLMIVWAVDVRTAARIRVIVPPAPVTR